MCIARTGLERPDLSDGCPFAHTKIVQVVVEPLDLQMEGRPASVGYPLGGICKWTKGDEVYQHTLGADANHPPIRIFDGHAVLALPCHALKGLVQARILGDGP